MQASRELQARGKLKKRLDASRVESEIPHIPILRVLRSNV
jgi:hypothetical protein